MIPKKIHYCWFGGKALPQYALDYIETWKKHFPGFEIVKWTEDNFDINMIPYTSEAYKAGKYAFVSDYARFWILYNYGGIYFDTDVEVIGDFSEVLANGPFMGCEHECMEGESPLFMKVNPGLGIGAPSHHAFYNKMLESYKDKHFLLLDGSRNYKTIVEYTTEMLADNGLKSSNSIQNCCGINIYPKDYFCPTIKGNSVVTTTRTLSIHHYKASWTPFRKKVKRFLYENLPDSIINVIFRIKALGRKYIA